MYTLGIDIGSTTSKCAILKDGKEIVAKSLVVAGTGTKGPMKAYEDVLENAGLVESDIDYIMATGYGRTTFEKMNGEMSELSCHGKGMFFVDPECRTIIDIGGQDAKVISLTDKGAIANFLMNDKCAAGTGRFLDVMAGILMIGVEDLDGLAAKSTAVIPISSTCTVFAESEVISQLSKNADKANLVAGICSSVASRVAALAKRGGIKEIVYMTGGVAQNGGVRRALEKELGVEIKFTPDAQYMGAIGAVLAGYQQATK